MEDKRIKIQFDINPILKEKIYEKIKSKGYSTVSEFFREMVRREVDIDDIKR